MNRSNRLQAIGLTCAIVSGFGCAGRTSYVARSTIPRSAPREPNCEFEVFTSRPDGYTEIGHVRVDPGLMGSHFYTLDPFKEEIRPHVCRAGGTAVHAQSTANGPEFLGTSRALWTLGTVLRPTEE